MALEDFQTRLAAFVAERDWHQFHTPDALAQSVSIEAGELLECFQWGRNPDAAEVAGELADVLTYCLLLADALGLDPVQIMEDKLSVTETKYPVELARGTSERYDRL